MKARGKSMDDMQGAWGEGDREEGPCIRSMRTPSYTHTHKYSTYQKRNRSITQVGAVTVARKVLTWLPSVPKRP